jgi:hypothetical protein
VFPVRYGLDLYIRNSAFKEMAGPVSVTDVTTGMKDRYTIGRG